MANKQLQYRLEYTLFLLVKGFIRWYPRFLVYPTTHFIAWLAFNVVRFRQKITLNNLAIAFPEASLEERKKIGLRCYRHFMLMVFEVFKMHHWTPEQLDNAHSDEPNGWRRDQAKESAIMVSGHHGNWEVGVALLGNKYWDKPVVVQRRQKNDLVSDAMTDIRESWGVQMVDSKGAVRKGVAALAKGRIMILLGDQDGGKSGIFVPFLGKIAATHAGPAVLSWRSGSPVFVAVNVRIAPWRFKTIAKNLDIKADREDKDAFLEETTAQINQALGEIIYQYPEQYLWFHKRWKTQTTFRSGKV